MILNSTQPLDGNLKINGVPQTSNVSVRIDAFGTVFNFGARENIRIYSFTSLMHNQNRSLINDGDDEKYIFSGPKLGLYSDTADIREGPYINHYISQLSLEVTYQAEGMMFTIAGKSDLPKSCFDRDFVSKKQDNDWEFAAEFFYRYHQIR